jgi:citrate lyase beta subunit
MLRCASMRTSLSSDALKPIEERLKQSNAEFAKQYPGESGRRQPVHTVYGGAHLFKSDTSSRLGALACRALAEYAPDPAVFASVLELPGSDELSSSIYRRVVDKLSREPVEDFRIDFEDGYGNRPDPEEDGHAMSAAHEVAAGAAAGTLPPFIGIRIKPLTEELRARSIRTLDIFTTALVEKMQGRLPDNFVVMLPKVVRSEQVAALAQTFELLEETLGLPYGSLKMEMMVETTQSIIDQHGASHLPLLLAAARGRLLAAHFGTYDYTASCSITASHQHMLHPSCDFARHMMKVAFAGTGIWLSDGATNIMPIGPDRDTVHRAWRLHYDHIQHSLANAFYQGWDLHPAQLPTRYAAVYAFFLEGLEQASERLRNFVAKAAQATLVGDVFDDAATGQGLLNYFLRAINCGAISQEEATKLTGLTPADLQSGSFVKILKNRR